MKAFSFSTAQIVDIHTPSLVLTTDTDLSSEGALRDLPAGPCSVLVEFLKVTDGRGFTLARRLREQLAENCAVVAGGHIIPDQADYLFRVGFSHALINTSGLLQWQKSLPMITTRFQHMQAMVRTRR